MKTLKLLSLITIVSIIFASCNSTNQVSSSFGKRKYMKGYYVNIPSDKRAYVVTTPQTASVDKITQHGETN